MNLHVLNDIKHRNCLQFEPMLTILRLVDEIMVFSHTMATMEIPLIEWQQNHTAAAGARKNCFAFF